MLACACVWWRNNFLSRVIINARRAGRDLDRRRSSGRVRARMRARGRMGELNIVAKLMPPIGVINARQCRDIFRPGYLVSGRA